MQPCHHPKGMTRMRCQNPDCALVFLYCAACMETPCYCPECISTFKEVEAYKQKQKIKNYVQGTKRRVRDARNHRLRRMTKSEEQRLHDRIYYELNHERILTRRKELRRAKAKPILSPV